MQNEPYFLRRVARLLVALFFASLFSNADLPRLVICALRGSVKHGVSIECKQVYVRYEPPLNSLSVVSGSLANLFGRA